MSNDNPKVNVPTDLSAMAADELREVVSTLRERLAEAERLNSEARPLIEEAHRECVANRELAEKAEQRAERAEQDAERWRDFTGCARVRVVGWAGLYDPVPGDEKGIYAHMGLELWTMHEAGSEPDAMEKIELFLSKVRAARSAT